jgi:hypothetical protein
MLVCMWRTVLLLISLTLASCAAPTRSVTLRVTDVDGTPIPRAHIRVIAIGTSDVPLPITSETLGELLATEQRSEQAVTNPEGEATVTVLAERRYLVEIDTPPLGGEWTSGRWLLDDAALSPANRTEPALRAQVVR